MVLRKFSSRAPCHACVPNAVSGRFLAKFGREFTFGSADWRVKPRPVASAAFTNNVFRRMRVGSSAGVRTVETVVAEMGFGPPSDAAENGRESTEELDDHL